MEGVIPQSMDFVIFGGGHGFFCQATTVTSHECHTFQIHRQLVCLIQRFIHNNIYKNQISTFLTICDLNPQITGGLPLTEGH